MKGKDWRPTAFVETAPGVVTEAEADASRLEQRRSLRAFVQTLIALDTATLLLTVALVEKSVAQPQRRELVAAAIGAFLLGIAAGGISTLLLAARTPPAGARRPPGDARPWLLAASTTFLCFLVGVTSLAAYFLAHWFR